MNPKQVSRHRRHDLAPLIVGVGSSKASGVEAFRELLAGLGDAPGLALLWVQHGDREPGELSDSTPMKLMPIAAGQKLQGGTLYIAPPHALVAIEQGELQLLERDRGRRGERPIDFLFRSIAQHQGEHSVAVLLSHAGGDGSLGLQAIRDRGGLSLASQAACVAEDAMALGAADAPDPGAIATELLRRVAAWPGCSGEPSQRQLCDAGRLEAAGCGTDPVVIQVEKELQRVRRELESMRLELNRSVQELRTANEELRASQDVTADLLGRSQHTVQHARVQGDDALADREAHLRRAINNQLGLVGVIDRQGLLVEVDDRSIRIAGLTREDVIGKHFADCAWWTYDEAVARKLRAAMQRAFAGEVMRYDVGLSSMDGSPLMIDFMLKPVRDPQGDVEYLVFSGVDISDRHAAEKENQATSAKLRALFDNAFYYTGVLDLNGVLVDINDSALKPMGLSREATLGLPFWDTPWWQGQDESQVKLKANFDKALAGGLYREVLPFLRPDRSQGYSDFIYTPAKDESGKVLFIVCNGSDVTERRQYEQRIAESRERLQMAMGAARMGAFEWDIEADRADWDEQWRELMGLPKDAPKTVETFFGLLHPDDLAASRSTLQGQGIRQERYEQEFRIVRPDGEVRWIAGRGNILLNDQGEPQRMIGLNWDVTAEKENERRILASEERLRLALRAAELKLWQWDVNDDHFYWSGERTEQSALEQSALDPLHSLGGLKKFLALVHPDDRQRVQQTLQTSLSQGTPYRCEYRVQCSPASYRWVMSLAHLSVERGNAPVQMIGVELDITQQREFEHSLKEAREQAVAANESKSLFLANMSHEIRTPMTAIMGYTDLVAGMVDQEEALSHLRTIRRNGDFLLEIINDILDLSKIEAGKFDIRYGHFAPHRLVEDVRSFMAVRAEEKNLSLDVEYQGAIPMAIESDPKGLKQILINLVGNAIKFTPRGSVKVVVRCIDIPCRESKLEDSTHSAELPATPSTFLQFDIIDTGIGMSEQQLQRLFQPFSQGDGNVNRQFGGTGLGLAISKRLTEMLGGEISVRTQLGQGSTFTVTVATGNIEAVKKIHPGRPNESPLREAPAATPRLDCHVLVVDDRRDIRFLSKMLLEKAGAQVSEAEDGEVAIAMVEDRIGKGKMFDLILLDMQMPRLDGYQTAEQLRALGYIGPIIALTADAMQGDMTRCIQSGCDDYLSKPIDKTLLINMIQQHHHDRRR